MNIALLLDVIDWKVFLALFLGVFLVASALFKPLSYGVFDVGWIVVATQSVGVTLVSYLYINGSSHLQPYAIFMNMAFLFFFLGAHLVQSAFTSLRPNRPPFNTESVEVGATLRLLSRILFFLQALIIALILLRASTQGLPIFYEDPELAKVEVNSGGFGLISRILNPSVTIAFSIIFLLQGFGYLRGWRLLVFMMPPLFALLASGSKGALIVLLVSYTAVQAFLFGRMREYKPPSSIKLLTYMTIGTLGYAVAVLLLRAIGTGEDDPWLFVWNTFGVRLIAFGDGVFYFFANDLVSKISFDLYDYIWDYILGPLLALVRLVDYPVSLGLKISGEMFGQDKLGPNPTMFVEGYVYFGFIGGLMYAGCLGMLFQMLRSNLFSRTRRFSAHHFINFSLMFSLSQLVASDMLLFHAELINSLLLMMMIWMAGKLFDFLFKRRRYILTA
jgi:oligosaccharide repeat unit polymerase